MSTLILTVLLGLSIFTLVYLFAQVFIQSSNAQKYQRSFDVIKPVLDVIRNENVSLVEQVKELEEQNKKLNQSVSDLSKELKDKTKALQDALKVEPPIPVEKPIKKAKKRRIPYDISPSQQ